LGIPPKIQGRGKSGKEPIKALSERGKNRKKAHKSCLEEVL